MTRKLLLISILCGFAGVTSHAETLWHNVPQKSLLAFTATWESNAVPGRFTSFEVRLLTVHATPRKLLVTVDIPSFRFRSPLLDHAARSRTWFDVRQFPKARFSSMAFQKTGAPGAYQAHGILEIKGIRHPFSIRFHLRQAGSGQLELMGTAQVTRTEFDIGTGPWKTSSVIGSGVSVRFEVRLVPNS